MGWEIGPPPLLPPEQSLLWFYVSGCRALKRTRQASLVWPPSLHVFAVCLCSAVPLSLRPAREPSHQSLTPLLSLWPLLFQSTTHLSCFWPALCLCHTVLGWVPPLLPHSQAGPIQVHPWSYYLQRFAMASTPQHSTCRSLQRSVGAPGGARMPFQAHLFPQSRAFSRWCRLSSV